MATSAGKRDLNTKKKKKGVRVQKSRSPEALDESLKLIFDSLAQLLVSSGYGYSRVAKLAKVSFVHAARTIDGERGAMVSIARIAALTGLTRTEVSQLLRGREQASRNQIEPANRALRVVKGWLADARYAHPNGTPRRLHFKAGNNSFSRLVKEYSGDIPARAMLSEMTRLRMVHRDDQDGVLLVRENLGISRATMLAMKAISPWVEMLTTGIGTNRLGEVISKTKQLNLTFNSLPQLLAAARELEHRRVAFVSGLEQLGDAGSENRKHSLRISIAVAAEKATRTKKHR